LTTTLAAASVAAYNDFDNPDNYQPQLNGYTFLDRFTGWDDWFWDIGVEERFGLIFQSQTVPGCFVVAFRGTDSDADAFEDAFFDYTTFQPYQNSVSPTPDDVSTGFQDIYSTMGGSMTQTMQQQIFGMLPTQQISEIYITGHSLGGALSQLFTLDMRVSFPDVNIQTINFASPKVGGSDWASACANAGAAQNITRVINYWDAVPDLPVDLGDDYVAVGAQFETAFYGGYILWDELHRHRLLNLQYVLSKCLPLNPQIWAGTFHDRVDKTYKMTSAAPPSASKDEMLAKLRELHSLERSIRAANGGSEPITPR
jgi:hypothetical protein